MTIDTIKLPNIKTLEKSTEQDLKDSTEAAEFVESIIVASDENLHAATRILAEIKNKGKEIELKEQTILTPLVEATKELKKFFKPAKEALKKAEKDIKKKVSDCIEERLETRDALLDELEEAPEDQRDDMLARADELVPPSIDGLSIYDQWTGELTSNYEVVEWAIQNNKLELLYVDTKALLAITKTHDKDPKIPGWKAFKKSIVKITVGKVK